jgi:hypothetical protein
MDEDVEKFVSKILAELNIPLAIDVEEKLDLKEDDREKIKFAMSKVDTADTPFQYSISNADIYIKLGVAAFDDRDYRR